VSCRIDLPSVHIPSSLAREFKSLCGSREILVKTRTMLINNVRGWTRTQLIRIRTGSTPTFQQRVREYAQATQIPVPEHIERQLAVLDALKVQIKAAEQQLVKLAGEHPVCRRLMTVPGVGPVTAVRFVAAIDDVTRFPNAHAVQSYMGLVPGESSSSSSERKQHTGSRRPGAMEVRRALIQAAWAAFRKAPKEPMVGWATQIAHHEVALLHVREPLLRCSRCTPRAVDARWAMWMCLGSGRAAVTRALIPRDEARGESEAGVLDMISLSGSLLRDALDEGARASRRCRGPRGCRRAPRPRHLPCV
jgi:transposase